MTFIERVREELSKGTLPVVVEADKPCPPASRADTVRRVAREILNRPVSVSILDGGEKYSLFIAEREGGETRSKKAALAQSGFTTMSAYLRHALGGIEVHETRNVSLHSYSPENVRVMLRQAIPGHRYRTQVLDEGTMSITRAS